MPEYYQKKSTEDQIIELGVTLFRLWSLKAGNDADARRVYDLEKQYEQITPGIVIGECAAALFNGKRPDQITKDLKLRTP